MLTFFIGLMLGTSFGFLIGAMMTHAKFADERIRKLARKKIGRILTQRISR